MKDKYFPNSLYSVPTKLQPFPERGKLLMSLTSLLLANISTSNDLSTTFDNATRSYHYSLGDHTSIVNSLNVLQRAVHFNRPFFFHLLPSASHRLCSLVTEGSIILYLAFVDPCPARNNSLQWLEEYRLSSIEISQKIFPYRNSLSMFSLDIEVSRIGFSYRIALVVSGKIGK